jgi:beta-glucosidase-like glycosyl hydrolase
VLERPIVVPWIRLDRDAAKEEAHALERAKKPWLAGFCLFGGEAGQVGRLTRRLREAAGRPIFVASDMERGAGQQVAGLRTLPDLAVLGVSGTEEDAEAFGEVTARDARSVGVDVLFAPVLDVRSEPENPIVGNRSLGSDPARVAALGTAFSRGALRGGAMPVAKHYPGHGATRADSHDAVPVVTDPEPVLRARDVAPFLRAIEGGCPGVMTAHVAYPALDPSGAIATFSRPVVGGLRAAAGPRGKDLVVFTDALLMAGAQADGSETGAGRRSLAAGCDALLIPSEPERLADEIDAEGGWEAAADAAAARLSAFAAAADALRAGPVRPGLDDVPRRVAERALAAQGGDRLPRESRGGRLVLVDDDDVPDRGRVLAERAKAAGVEVVTLRLSRSSGSPAVNGLSATTVVVMSSVRAWKGAARVSPAGAALVDRVVANSKGAARVAWLSPRPPDGPFALHVPGTGSDVEAALAKRLFGA